MNKTRSHYCPMLVSVLVMMYTALKGYHIKANFSTHSLMHGCITLMEGVPGIP